MSNFKEHFGTPVAHQWAHMSRGPLYRVNLTGDQVWDAYMAAFPEGTNPMFRKRREFDCSCCRQFIKALGNVVSIEQGRLVSIWDIASPDGAFDVVATTLSVLVRNTPIRDFFAHTEGRAGTDKSFEYAADDRSDPVIWHHFFCHIPNSFVVAGPEMGKLLGDSRTLREVFESSLKLITFEACETVLDLIAQGSLYRGDEQKHAVTLFQHAKRLWKEAPDPVLYTWEAIGHAQLGPVAGIKNMAIGTLLVNLSEDMELETAVKKWEGVMAPQNYRRTTALVTPAMVTQARAKLTELGLINALQRRYAHNEDVSAADVLFVDRSSLLVWKGDDAFDGLATHNQGNKISKVEEIGIGDFITDVLPRVSVLEVFVENKHVSHLVSLIASADPTAPNLFKWGNSFSWSYNGEYADAIKERVKQAGGNVTGDFLCRLSWSNFDDLDLHLIEPTGNEIFFRKKESRNGGRLDVDMNAGSGTSRTPVENIFYADANTMAEGAYHLFVHQYCARESKDVGFTVEVEFKGDVTRFDHPKALRHGDQVTVLNFHYDKKRGIIMAGSLPPSTVSRDAWGLKTQQWQRVNLMCLSPNGWDAIPIGHLHYFLMLAGCSNPGTARGFYNEFLKPELNPHRKVLELVGAKMQTTVDSQQLSGLGFSSTVRESIMVRVTGAFTRILKVNF